MKMGFKKPIAQLENSRKSLASGMNQAEGRILGLKEELCQTSNEYEKN